jgi:hypothetical protein
VTKSSRTGRERRGFLRQCPYLGQPAKVRMRKRCVPACIVRAHLGFSAGGLGVTRAQWPRRGSATVAQVLVVASAC